MVHKAVRENSVTTDRTDRQHKIHVHMLYTGADGISEVKLGKQS